jgi:IS30 family transposase
MPEESQEALWQLRSTWQAQNLSGCFAKRVSTDERPAIADTRLRLGNREVDTIIGKGHRQAIVPLTERKSRLALL